MRLLALSFISFGGLLHSVSSSAPAAPFIPVQDTGTKELQQHLKDLLEQAGGASIQSTVETNYFRGAYKDNNDHSQGEWDAFNTVSGQSVNGPMYKVNRQWFNPEDGGPIFLLLGAESPLIDSDIQESTYINHAAKLFHAMVVGIEHRYYGVSRPTTNFGSNEAHLLSSSQALADAAEFIQWFKLTQTGVTPDTPVIVFGYSYGGCLSAWFKRKYPNLAVGAISSSGPLLAKIDFLEYMETVAEAITSLGSIDCYDALVDGTKAFEAKLAAGNYAALVHDFGYPYSVTSYEDGLALANQMFKTPWGLIAQYNDVTQDLPGECTQVAADYRALLEADDDPSIAGYIALANFAKRWAAKPQSLSAVEEGEEGQQLLTSNLVTDFTKFAWNWQFCNEFGYLQTLSAEDQPFAALSQMNAAYVYKTQCQSLFGSALLTSQPDVTTTNTRYGGLFPATTNVTYIHGSLDPWHRLGIADGTIFSELYADVHYIEDGSHCNDATSPDVLDTVSQSLKDTYTHMKLDIQHYLEGTPWAHNDNVDDTAVYGHSASKKNNDCGFDVVVKKTRMTVKYGEQIKIDFSIKVHDSSITDDLLVGVEHWDNGIHFVKGQMTPSVNKNKKGPTLEHDGVIYWEEVPANRGSRNFKASFFAENQRREELYPGACLYDPNTLGSGYCCQYKTVKVNIVEP